MDVLGGFQLDGPTPILVTIFANHHSYLSYRRLPGLPHNFHPVPPVRVLRRRHHCAAQFPVLWALLLPVQRCVVCLCGFPPGGGHRANGPSDGVLPGHRHSTLEETPQQWPWTRCVCAPSPTFHDCCPTASTPNTRYCTQVIETNPTVFWYHQPGTHGWPCLGLRHDVAQGGGILGSLPSPSDGKMAISCFHWQAAQPLRAHQVRVQHVLLPSVDGFH